MSLNPNTINYWPVSFQSLQTEIENHEPRIISLLETGEALINEGHPQSEEFRALIDDLMKRWQDLKDSIDRRNERLVLSDTAQQVSKAIVETSAPDKIKVDMTKPIKWHVCLAKTQISLGISPV